MSRFAQARCGIGAFLILMGTAVMAGWFLRNAFLVRIAPEFVGMVFSTAFCFALTGLGLLLPDEAKGWRRPARTLIATAVTALGLLSLMGNFANMNVGFDYPEFHAWLDDGNIQPGRMAAITSIGFLLAGLTLLLMQNVRSKARGTAVQITTFALFAVGAAGIVGYVLNLELLYSWFHSTRMALRTAIGMILASAGCWAGWSRADWYRSQRYFKEDEKVSFVGAVALFVCASIAGIAGFASQQWALEKTLTDKLATLMARRVDLFQSMVQSSIADAGRLATRRDVVAAMRTPERLHDIFEYVVGGQVGAVAAYDLDDRLLAQGGKFLNEPEITIGMKEGVPATLYWKDGLYARTRLEVKDGGKPVGYLVVEQALQVLTEQMTRQEEVGRTGSIAMCMLSHDHFHCLPMNNDMRTVRIARYNPVGEKLPMNRAVTGHSGTFRGLDYKGRNVIALYAPVTGSELGIVVKQETEELYRPVRDQFERTVPVLLLFVSLCAWLLRLHVKPLATKILQSEAEAREALADVKAGKERIRTIIESAQDAFVGMDLNGNIIDWNSQAQAMFGLSREEALGRPVIATIFPRRLQPMAEETLRKFNGRDNPEFVNQRLENKVVNRDGREVPVEMVIGLVAANDDYFFSIFIRDISARKEAEQELLQAKDRAEAATRAKSEFLANMSHEIRTPLNGVIGLTAIMLKTPMSAQQHEYMSLIKASADSLLRLLNDILDFSKMEARQLELENIEFDVRESIGNTLKAFAASANEKGVELTYQVAPNVPASLLGDPGRLSQIIVNLVGNALKFTARGEVVVRLARRAHDGAGVLLDLQVSDTGIGMSAQQQSSIFNAFAQADSSTTRKYGGTGLGLSIVSQLVALMDGSIRVDSVPGKGSSFHLTLRLAGAGKPRADAPEPQPVVLKGMPVLIVDDNRSNRLILSEIIASWGMRPVLAEDGRAGLRELEIRAAQGMAFPLVLIDSQMPRFDGFDLAEAIKADPSIDSAAIMMLSSSDLSGEIARCKALGVARFLRKPVKQSELFNAIITAMGVAPAKRLAAPADAADVAGAAGWREQREHREQREQQEQAERPARPRPPGRMLKVLVAEDHPVNQTLVGEILKERGHAYAIAANGMEVLDLLERESFDVILMDGQMPEMDGYQATGEIRRREQATGKHIRIIALTAHAMTEDRDKCLAAGMDDYVAKPIDPDRLIALLEAGARQQPDDAPQAAAVQVQAKVQAAFDHERALAAARGKRAFMEKMAGLLLQSLPDGLADIRKAYEAGDAHALERSAHRLRGAAVIFHAAPLAQVLERIERHAREHAPAAPETLSDMLRELELRADELTDALEAVLQDTQ